MAGRACVVVTFDCTSATSGAVAPSDRTFLPFTTTVGTSSATAFRFLGGRL